MNLLIDDKPLLVLPRLACAVGLEESIFLQQVHYLCRNGHGKDGGSWVYNTYEEWIRVFPFWNEAKIGRVVRSLERQGVLKTTKKYNARKMDKRKWYAVDYENTLKAVEQFFLSHSDLYEADANLNEEDSNLNELYTKTFNIDFQTNIPTPRERGGADASRFVCDADDTKTGQRQVKATATVAKSFVQTEKHGEKSGKSPTMPSAMSSASSAKWDKQHSRFSKTHQAIESMESLKKERLCGKAGLLPPLVFAELANGLQAMLSLGLSGRPAFDTAMSTLLLWESTLASSGQWQDFDAKRVQLTFASLLKTAQRFPSPADFLRALPPRLMPSAPAQEQATDAERVAQRAMMRQELAKLQAIVRGVKGAGL